MRQEKARDDERREAEKESCLRCVGGIQQWSTERRGKKGRHDNSGRHPLNLFRPLARHGRSHGHCAYYLLVGGDRETPHVTRCSVVFSDVDPTISVPLKAPSRCIYSTTSNKYVARHSNLHHPHRLSVSVQQFHHSTLQKKQSILFPISVIIKPK